MLLKQLLEENNLHFEDKFYEDCEVFIKLLQQWGKVHNLSGRLLQSDIEENILDSIYPLNFINKYNFDEELPRSKKEFLEWFEENRDKIREINNPKDKVLDFFS